MYLGNSPRAVINSRKAIASAANMVLDCGKSQSEFRPVLREFHSDDVPDCEDNQDFQPITRIHGLTLCYVDKDNAP